MLKRLLLVGTRKLHSKINGMCETRLTIQKQALLTEHSANDIAPLHRT